MPTQTTSSLSMSFSFLSSCPVGLVRAKRFTRSMRFGGGEMTQWVEHLLCQCENPRLHPPNPLRPRNGIVCLESKIL